MANKEDNKAWVVLQTTPFIGGLNTEINDLQDATQYTSDELNMVIKNNGTRARRLGIDYEEGYKLSNEIVQDFIEWVQHEVVPNSEPAPLEGEGDIEPIPPQPETDVIVRRDFTPAFTAFEWTDITDEANLDYIVVQAGGYLYFYENNGAPFSQAQTVYRINLEDYKLSEEEHDTAYAEEPVSYANAYGGLFVCSKAIKPFVVTNLKEDPDEEPTAATAQLPFNRFNIGWYKASGIGPRIGIYADFDNRQVDANCEVRFKINNQVVGVSQLFYDNEVYYTLADNVYNQSTWTRGFVFGSPTHAGIVDDFGNAIVEEGAILDMPYGSRWVLDPEYNDYYYHQKAIMCPSAKYFADLWNTWRDQGKTMGITAQAVTPFQHYWSDTEEVLDRENGYYRSKAYTTKETFEFLNFTCPVGLAYDGINITMEYVPRGFIYTQPSLESRQGEWLSSPEHIWSVNGAGCIDKGQGTAWSPYLYSVPRPFITTTRGYKTPNVSQTLDVQIRDFVGVKDIYHDVNINVDVDLNKGEGLATRPLLPTVVGTVEELDPELNAHLYNLFNQGWNRTQLDAYKALDTHNIDNISYSVYPSNNYQWYLSKDQSTNAFKPADLIKIAFGNTRAPNGRGIITYLKQDRNAAMNSVSDSAERIIAGEIPISYPRIPYFSDIIAYAGRVWYLSGDTILYSQVLVEDITKADKCYQEADPTSETISDLLDTDGGMIQIPELGEGIRFCLVGSALAVVGTKSIQLISGGQNNAFTATAYVRGGMQAYSSVAPRSFVTTEYGTFFWSDVGIVMLSYQEGFAAQNITEHTINTFYQRIPDEAKKKCVGIYNRAQKQVIWMYPEDPEVNNLNKMLVFDILKQSWTPFEVGSGNSDDGLSKLPWVVGGLTMLNSYNVATIYPIYAEVPQEISPNIYKQASLPIVNDDGDTSGRILAADPVEREEKTFKSAVILCLDRNENKFTFGNFDNLNCLDWASGDLYGPGVNYNSYLVSHPINFGSTTWNKTIPYFLSYFRRTEQGYTTDGVKIYPSACQGAILWDWNNSGKAGKWDAQQELYRYDKHFDNYTVVADDATVTADGETVGITDPVEKSDLLVNEYVYSKTRVYGGGRAFQVKLSSKGNNYFIVENVGFNVYGDARI